MRERKRDKVGDDGDPSLTGADGKQGELTKTIEGRILKSSEKDRTCTPVLKMRGFTYVRTGTYNNSSESNITQPECTKAKEEKQGNKVGANEGGGECKV